MMMGDVRAVTPGSRFEGGKTRKTPPRTCATRNLANESSKLKGRTTLYKRRICKERDFLRVAAANEFIF